jgi:hypothetical protein
MSIPLFLFLLQHYTKPNLSSFSPFLVEMGSTPLITYLSEFIGPTLTVLYLALSLITSQFRIPAILTSTSRSSPPLVQQASTLLRRSKLELTPLVVIILLGWVCLTNDSYRLAQLVYVCYEPIEEINHKSSTGRTFASAVEDVR